MVCEAGEVGRQHVVEAVQVEGDHFAPVPADDLRAGVLPEGPGQNQAQDVDAGFVVPAPPGQRELRGDLGGEAGVVGLLNIWQRDAWVGVERHAQVVQSGGGIGRVHQAEVRCLVQDSRPGGFVRRGVDCVFFDADDFHVGLPCVQ
jgi:hypothetical protein